MRVAKLAYLCAFLPVIAVHLTWSLAFVTGDVDGCLVYWGYCHSISATGREYPEFFVFKALMIPVAVLMMLYWMSVYQWLMQLSVTKASASRIRALGMIAAVALILYTVTLGASGEPWALPRRIGAVLYFAFTSFAHLALLYSVSRQNELKKRLGKGSQHLARLCAVLILMGVISALLGYLWPGYRNWDNAFEWWFALLMMGQFILVGRMMAFTKFEIHLTVNAH
ncbi:hypothetical protein [Aestuariibacter salexigens]|uniref:hypothetical protein n=1 Tax=Aestuariibacter salexigens TaxID=226010 RepID=UPI00047A4269|nr:hypothetical protein [Aestuariibacter salexigens]